MIKNKKRFRLICITLLFTIFLILQPYELTFTSPASGNDTWASPPYHANDIRYQPNGLKE